jgi:Holliday junction resolvase RusA-like endonuclease
VTVTFHVPGPPVGKGRARFSTKTGRAYTPSQTINAEAHIALCWQQTGAERIDQGPVFLEVLALLDRPRSHFNSRGELNAAGKANWWCIRRPDVDNQIKLVADALNGVAYRDDAQVVTAHIHRRWAQPGETAGLTITLSGAQVETFPTVERREAA